MRGVILGSGIISGDDGKRYQFHLQDIQNLEGRSEQSLEKCEVDFEIDESGEKASAKAIFITKSSANVVDSITNSLNDNSISSIKLKAYIGIIFSALAFIPFLGWFFAIAGVVVYIFALIGISRESGCKSIIFNFIISAVLSFISTIIISFSTVSAVVGALSNADSGIFAGIGFAGIIGFIIAISALYFSYKYYSLLSEATNERLFFYAFIISVIATLTIFIPLLGILLTIISYIVQIVAWVKFKEIRKIN
ncbi:MULTISPECIES: hypothetical protein [Helicobacter]|uniref:2-amino-4-hydroxy-6-hydroxymethyldihydropteridine pyrophosphokinase n=1 Tax=Helicobacter colisuis TaxID=2949739 RepID=A0ABT0TVA8_9HELI|nr:MULTISPECIES: hypothetical protein [Helicobacter]MCI2235909.1 hypothetical protein [Helicobacter sp. CaF467b]MCL9819222.1 hypothetical protein [Helicobacter colisuis]MCL9821378.1 hypothetical protein [Helicobacter colisuis]MDY4427189.1 hypothetical protein [Helicobacter sp.]RAX51413.1 hypothetical protein CCY98_08185 [Helicobacter sp. 11-8110]